MSPEGILSIALLPVVTAILGAYFGARWKASRDQQQWRRQQELDAFTDFMGALDPLPRLAQELANVEGTTTDLDMLWSSFDQQLELLNRAGNRIALLSSSKTTELAIEVCALWTHVIRSWLRQDRKLLDDVTLRELLTLDDARYWPFVRMARHELGVHSRPYSPKELNRLSALFQQTASALRSAETTPTVEFVPPE